MSAMVDYDFAVLRVVPRVHLGAFVNVGVVVHARTVEFLALRAVTDERILAAHVPGVDAELLARYLRSCEAICAGDVSAGPMALAPTSFRAHRCTKASPTTLGEPSIDCSRSTSPSFALLAGQRAGASLESKAPPPTLIAECVR